MGELARQTVDVELIILVGVPFLDASMRIVEKNGSVVRLSRIENSPEHHTEEAFQGDQVILVEIILFAVDRKWLEHVIRGNGEGSEDDDEDDENVRSVLHHFDTADNHRAQGFVEEKPAERSQEGHAGSQAKDCRADIDRIVAGLIGSDVVRQCLECRVVQEASSSEQDEGEQIVNLPERE